MRDKRCKCLLEGYDECYCRFCNACGSFGHTRSYCRWQFWVRRGEEDAGDDSLTTVILNEVSGCTGDDLGVCLLDLTAPADTGINLIYSFSGFTQNTGGRRGGNGSLAKYIRERKAITASNDRRKDKCEATRLERSGRPAKRDTESGPCRPDRDSRTLDFKGAPRHERAIFCHA